MEVTRRRRRESRPELLSSKPISLGLIVHFDLGGSRGRGSSRAGSTNPAAIAACSQKAKSEHLMKRSEPRGVAERRVVWLRRDMGYR